MTVRHTHSVALQFDTALDSRLRPFWQKRIEREDAAGVPAWHRELGPHLSLGGGPGLDRLDWRRICHELPAWPEVVLESAGLFPGGVVAFAAPRVTLELLEFHAALYRAVGQDSRNWLPHYQPGAWHPHCTMLKPLSADAGGQAVEELAALLPLHGSSTRLVLYTMATAEVVTLAERSR